LPAPRLVAEHLREQQGSRHRPAGNPHDRARAVTITEQSEREFDAKYTE
jgi:hypothetical protein